MKNYIRKLAKKRNAIILAHNYQPPDIQDIADLCGDSLDLSVKASKNKYDIIVFCGVKFMAETASILSPKKRVLLPKNDASCPMVDMVKINDLKKHIHSSPHIPIVTYVNSSAEVKALSNICCTSANMNKVVNSLKNKEILMIPDKNLAENVKKNTDKKIHNWSGYCPVHNKLTAEEVLIAKTEHPNALFLAHPECQISVTKIADLILSTSGMVKYVSKSKEKEFIIGTEIGLLYQLKKKNPNKKFFPAATHMICKDMKKIKLEDIVKCLENITGEIKISKKTKSLAIKSLERMLFVS